MIAASPEAIAAVALDLDGSLAGADHRVSSRALRALTALEARGVSPIIVTGRMPAAARTPSVQAGLSAPVISCNGAVIEDPATGERLWEQHLPVEVVRDVLEVAERGQVTATLWSPARMYASRRDASVALLEELNGQEVTVVPLETVATEPVVKAMIAGSSGRLDELADEITGTIPLMMRSMDNFFETSPPGVSKAGALRHVLGHLGVDPGACLGVGDGDNDLEWLTMIGVAVAPAGARPSVKAVAAEVIGDHADDGVAAFLESFFDLAAGDRWDQDTG